MKIVIVLLLYRIIFPTITHEKLNLKKMISYILGHYMMVDYGTQSSSVFKGSLFLPSLDVPHPTVCLTFKYQLQGSLARSLYLFWHPAIESSSRSYIWHTAYAQEEKWWSVALTLNGLHGNLEFEVVFQKKHGNQGRAAIDDIMGNTQIAIKVNFKISQEISVSVFVQSSAQSQNKRTHRLHQSN